MGQVYTVDGKRDGNHNDDLTRDKEAKFPPLIYVGLSLPPPMAIAVIMKYADGKKL